MKLKLNWESALLALLIVEILLFGALNPRMLDLNMLLFSTSDFICIGIVALPLTLVIISGGIDISLGSTIGLCAIALGVMTQAGWPLWLAVSLTLLLGLLCGLFNAALIHYTGISPLVITLGTLYLSGGGALLRAWDVTVDTVARSATRAGVPVALTPREFDLLEQLLRNRGAALYRDVLFERVWGGEMDDGTRTLDLHIQRLRKKLGWQEHIKTVYKVGYLLEMEGEP